MRHFEYKIFHKQSEKTKMSKDETIVRSYLENESPVAYGEHALEVTVQDILALDSDLKEYVLRFLQSKDMTSSIQCECASVTDLIQTGSFTPITAALFIQWYRRDPMGAASFLLHHDMIKDIPEDIPEENKDELFSK